MINLDRNLHSAPGIKATWKLITFDNKPTAKVCCPDCGYEANVTPTHTISDGGDVSPSLECPQCGFHDHIHLNNWIHDD